MCAAQGAREKKLDVGADIRRIEDATAPHRTLEGDDHVVRSVNDMMTLLDDDGRPLAPKERKPDNGYLMRGNAKLQSAAAVWCEPVVILVDDMKAAFNQFFLHPSQTWLVTILWLDLFAAEPEMQHVIQLSLGFGLRLASNYVQRFAHALVWLMHKRLAVAMKAEFDNEKDPSKRAWLDAQIALGAGLPKGRPWGQTRTVWPICSAGVRTGSDGYARDPWSWAPAQLAGGTVTAQSGSSTRAPSS